MTACITIMKFPQSTCTFLYLIYFADILCACYNNIMSAVQSCHSILMRHVSLNKYERESFFSALIHSLYGVIVQADCVTAILSVNSRESPTLLAIVGNITYSYPTFFDLFI